MVRKTTADRRQPAKGRKHWAIATLLASSVLSGCSQVPDAVNPVEWYNNSVEFFSGEEQKTEAATAAKSTAGNAPVSSGVNQAFPNLASVEEQKRRSDVRSDGLVADTQARKYAPAISRQGEAVNALGAPPPKPQAPTASAAMAPPTQPAPPAMPSVAVTSTGAAPLSVASAPSTDPLATTRDHENFQAQMARRLAEIRARASQGSGLPEYVARPVGPDVIETVVISSGGVESGYGASAAASLPVNSELSYIQRPMAPLASGAVKVATIMFSNGSSSLSSRDRTILANVRSLQKERGGRLRVVGHASSRTQNTNPVRHKMINFKVSAARADAVARELVRMGLKKSNLQIDAVSDSVPVYYEFMPSGEAGNRRTEIYLES